jgi:hypothetical protein
MFPRMFPLSPRPGRRVTGLVLLCRCQRPGCRFLEDSSAKIEARNVYFNQDFRDGYSSSSRA